MEIPLLRWEIDNYTLEISIDFESLKRDYGVYEACNKYPPMIRDVQRTVQKYSMTGAIASILSIESDLRAKNKLRKYRIPINYISYTSNRLEGINWISRDTTYDIPLILDPDFCNKNAEIFIHYSKSTIQNYVLCRSLDVIQQTDIHPLVIHEGLKVLSVVESEEGYKFPGCGKYRIIISDSLEGQLCYKEYNIVTHEDKIIDDTYRKAVAMIEFRGTMNVIVVDDLVYKDINISDMQEVKNPTGMFYYKILD